MLNLPVRDEGSRWAVFGDPVSGDSGCRFRFLYPAAPDAEGCATADVNRAVLPPCAFADHFICPFPPPDDTLGVAVPAGSAPWPGERPIPPDRKGVSKIDGRKAPLRLPSVRPNTPPQRLSGAQRVRKPDTLAPDCASRAPTPRGPPNSPGRE
ncbi:DUF1684 domain-containing protein [Streptomyces sp. NBC_00285]|uniref:DUF1684 domain-containing protein n=1 Tax=Streptomyces sp. NBC_00285 TaxID=2975700 RepID=UPI003FA6A2C9